MYPTELILLLPFLMMMAYVLGLYKGRNDFKIKSLKSKIGNGSN
jgi:hypothetical protein